MKAAKLPPRRRRRRRRNWIFSVNQIRTEIWIVSLVTLQGLKISPVDMRKDTCVMWHNKPHKCFRDPRCGGSKHSRSQGISGGVSVFSATLQDLPWQENSSWMRWIGCLWFCVKVWCHYRNMWFIPGHIKKKKKHVVAVKMKNTTWSLPFFLFFSSPLPPSLVLFSSLCSVYLSQTSLPSVQ